MTLKSAQEHHRRAEELYRESEDVDLIQMTVSMAIAGYLEETVKLLGGVPGDVVQLPAVGQITRVQGF